jgi:hypothetical protein
MVRPRRDHWGIENRSHYARDVTFAEDASRIHINPGIFARLRSFAYNILRFNQPTRSAKTDIEPLSAEWKASSPWPSVESVEQPWGYVIVHGRIAFEGDRRPG